MFSLIITIISIALVAALALATLYYGGDAFNRGSVAAQASRLINEGQQANGAVALAKADAAAGDAAVTTWDGLVDAKYLSQLPASLGLTGTDTIADVSLKLTQADAILVCYEVQKRATGSTSLPVAVPAGQVYGCINDGTNGATFFYKM